MSVQGQYLIDRVKEVSKSVEAYLSWARKEVLLSFDQAERDADQIRQNALAELRDHAAGDVNNVNSGSAAADSDAAGIYVFANTMPSVRSSIVSVLASKLFERLQQELVNLCHDKAFLTPPPNDPKLESIDDWCEKHFGFKIQEFLAWPKIEQMQLLADVVKEKDSESALKLRNVCPEFFQQLGMEQLHPDSSYWLSPLDPGSPGEGLYLTDKSLEDYGTATLQFLREMSERFQANEFYPR